MAESPTHRFGQIIGELLETAIRPVLETVAKKHRLYLDSKGPRSARGGKRKVVWVDGKGNAHDLDYVLESGGNEEAIGVPKAFIEIAWRRYTKHSRNKAQEIQGAVIPLAEHHKNSHPFLGVILAGVFTEASLNQLRSHGFQILYFPYESVVAAFASVGIDARFDEYTPDSNVLRKVRQYQKLAAAKRDRLACILRDQHKSEFEQFTSALEKSLSREVEFAYVLPLHGRTLTFTDIAAAIAFIEAFDESSADEIFARYEVGVRYSNGDEVRGQFENKKRAIVFLGSLR